MSALLTSPPGRMIGLATLGLLAGTIASVFAWHFAWSRYGFVYVANATPSWVAVSLVIFIAASLSSTVGFAFSAIAAAMIFHFVPDNVEAVQIMMVASIAIQAYSVAGMWRTISMRACAPFLIGGVATIPAGISLLLHFPSPTFIFSIRLEPPLYSPYLLRRPPPSFRAGRDLIGDAPCG